ncbi:MAG TPA: hypothetical protein EYP56_08495, partial [Planctomycetaceae bacterium]|nr:hypothetical protein [Planctomycetaceae bacterium]
MIERLIRHRYLLLAAAVVLAAAAFFPARQLELNRSIQGLFAPDDPRLVIYDRLRRSFGGNEIVLAVYRDDDVLAVDGRGIERLAQLSRRLAQVPGVAFTLSLDQPMGKQIVDPRSLLAHRARQVLEGYTHGADGRTVAVICVLDAEGTGAASREKTVASIRRIVARQPSGVITGEPVMVADGFRYIERDGRRLAWATATLMSAVIFFSFRSLRWVIIPLAVVQLATLLARAALVLLGRELTMVSSMFTATVTVIGIASVVHIIVRWREHRMAGAAPAEALRRAGRQLAAPIAWSVLTDAAAFCALMLSPVGPVRDFGLMMALGALMVLVAIVLLVPGLALAGSGGRPPRPLRCETYLAAGL